MPTVIQPYEATDLDAAVALGIDSRGVDDSGMHLHVAKKDGAVVGVGVLLADSQSEAYLAFIGTKVRDWPLMFQLAAACCQDAIDQGHIRGYFVIKSATLLERVKAEFDIKVEVRGRHPGNQEAAEWEIHVDLADAMVQLARFL